MSAQGLLADTCAVLFIAMGVQMPSPAMKALARSSEAGALHVSPVSAWEIGMLAASGKLGITTDPLDFFNDFVTKPGIMVCDLPPEIMVASSFLPNLPHKDPMDRLLIATARKNGLTLVTRDRAILAYGAAGHVKTLAC